MKKSKLVLLLALSVPLIILSCKKSSTAPQHHYTSTNATNVEITPTVIIDSSTSYQWVVKVSFAFTSGIPVDSVTFLDHIQYDVYDGAQFKFTNYSQNTLTQGVLRRDTIPGTLVSPNIQNIKSDNVTYTSNGSVDWNFALYGVGIPSN